jgi:hypothetical protein
MDVKARCAARAVPRLRLIFCALTQVYSSITPTVHLVGIGRGDSGIESIANVNVSTLHRLPLVPMFVVHLFTDRPGCLPRAFAMCSMLHNIWMGTLMLDFCIFALKGQSETAFHVFWMFLVL